MALFMLISILTTVRYGIPDWRRRRAYLAQTVPGKCAGIYQRTLREIWPCKLVSRAPSGRA